MEFQVNLLRQWLGDIYVICGNTCAGRTTMARMLADKYGFYLYDMDRRFHDHLKLANPILQPNMSIPRDDLQEFVCRPVDTAYVTMKEAIREEAPMVYLDLLQMPKDKPVIADLSMEPEDLKGIIPDNRVVFLATDLDCVKYDYMNRQEKLYFTNAVKGLPDPEAAFSTVFQSIDRYNRYLQTSAERAGYLRLDRAMEDTRGWMLQQIEAHYCL